MRNELNEPTKNNLPNDMIDWNEISEFIIDMLDPKYRGNKGWKVINDTPVTSILKENSVIVLKMIYNDYMAFSINCLQKEISYGIEWRSI